MRCTDPKLAFLLNCRLICSERAFSRALHETRAIGIITRGPVEMAEEVLHELEVKFSVFINQRLPCMCLCRLWEA